MEINTREIKINPPEGFEIDRENSTFDCIRFKPIEVKRWKDNPDKVVNGHLINAFSRVIYHSGFNHRYDYNLFFTEEQAKSALAMARISQIMANDSRFGGIITDEEWDSNEDKFIIKRERNSIATGATVMFYYFLAFHTKQQRDLFLEENENLVREYLML